MFYLKKNFIFTEKLQEYYRELLYNSYPVSLIVNVTLVHLSQPRNQY